LIAPDIVGLGFSSRPPASFRHTIEAHSAIIGEVIDILELDDTIFVGQDWGGPIGLHAFRHRRDRLTGLVMLNTVVGPPKPGFKSTAFHRFARLPVISDVAFGIGFPQAGMFLAQGDKGSIRGAVARAYRYPLRGGPKRNRATLELARMVPDSQEHYSIAPLRECQEVFTEVNVPVSMVWGDRDPVLGSVRSWLEKLRPDAEVTRTRAGHFLQEEVPDEIADAVRSVVSRSDSGADAEVGR
jgi:haloalkane dehalogenase